MKEVYNPDMYPGLMKNLQADVASGKAPSIAMIGYNYLDYFNENFQYVSPEELAKRIRKIRTICPRRSCRTCWGWLKREIRR